MPLPSLLGTAAIVEAMLHGGTVFASRLSSAGCQPPLTDGELDWVAAISAFHDLGSLVGIDPIRAYGILEAVLHGRERPPQDALNDALTYWFGDNEEIRIELLKAVCSPSLGGQALDDDRGMGVVHLRNDGLALVGAVLALDDRLRTYFPNACIPIGLQNDSERHYMMTRLLAGIIDVGSQACTGAQFHGSVDWQNLQATAPHSLAALDLHYPLRAPWPTHVLPGAPRGVQGLPLTNLSSLVVLSDVVRGGKTLACIEHGLNLEREHRIDNIIIACRTRAAVLHLYDYLVGLGLFPQDSIVRGLPWNHDPEGPWVNRRRERYMLARLCVTTQEQIWNALRPEPHAYMRSAAIARSLLVLDDVRAVDPMERALSLRLVQSQVSMGGYVAITSAVLDRTMRERFLLERIAGDHPQVHDQDQQHYTEAIAEPYSSVWIGERDGAVIHRHGQARTNDDVEVIIVDVSALDEVTNAQGVIDATRNIPAVNEHIARLAISHALLGAKVLVIRNTYSDTLRTAQAVFQINPSVSFMLETPDGPRAVAYHTHYSPLDREQIDMAARTDMGYGAPVRTKGKGVVIVATPQAANGLHLDSDVLFTDFAPFDDLLRRAGRVHAEERDRPVGYEEPRLFIISPHLLPGESFHDHVTPTGSPSRRSMGRGIGRVYKNLFALQRTWFWITQGPLDVRHFLHRGEGARQDIEDVFHPYVIQEMMASSRRWQAHSQWLESNSHFAGPHAAAYTLGWLTTMGRFGLRACDPRPSTQRHEPNEVYLPEWQGMKVFFDNAISFSGRPIGPCIVWRGNDLVEGQTIQHTRQNDGTLLFGRGRWYDNWGDHQAQEQDPEEQDE